MRGSIDTGKEIKFEIRNCKGKSEHRSLYKSNVVLNFVIKLWLRFINYGTNVKNKLINPTVFALNLEGGLPNKSFIVESKNGLGNGGDFIL